MITISLSIRLCQWSSTRYLSLKICHPCRRGNFFSKLDLLQAYLQVWLNEKLTPYIMINTRQGLYRHTRLPFGVASAPVLFRKMMDTVLQGIPGVISYIDDILFSGRMKKNHLKSLEEVFQRLEKHGFRLRRDKCEVLLVLNKLPSDLQGWYPDVRCFFWELECFITFFWPGSLPVFL